MSGIALNSWKRAVIKVGSGLIAPNGKRTSTKYTLPIAGFITECRNQGKEIILVSSGAVASGLSTQPEMQKRSQRTIPEKTGACFNRSGTINGELEPIFRFSLCPDFANI